MSVHKTFCRHCTSLCGLEVVVEDNKVVSLKGDRDHPISQGYSCIMGQHNLYVQDSPDRLKTAQIRQPNGTFSAVEVDTALQDIGLKLKGLIEKWGPRSVALYYGTGTFYSGLAYAMANSWLKAIGSPELYTSLTVDQSAKWVSAYRMGTFATGKPLYRDLDALMLVGVNPVVSHQGIVNSMECPNPLKQLAEARQLGVKIIVVDPRRTETAQRADLHLQIIPGEDAVLMAALIREILAQGWQDATFCARFAVSLDRLQKAVQPFTLDVAAARTGVPAAQIALAARMFGTAPRRTVASGTGPNMARHSNLSEHLLEALNAICGGYRKAGDPIRNTGGLFNCMPTTEMVVPPARSWEGEPRMRSVDCGPFGSQFAASRLPDEILHRGDNRIRALLSFGGNPATALGGNAKTVEALESLELLVSIDPRENETGKFAHYIIPTKLPFERADLTVVMDNFFSRNFVNWTEPLVEAPSGVIEDWEVFYNLAQHMGVGIDFQTGPYGMQLPNNTALDMVNKPSTEDMFRLTCAMGRVSLDQLKASSGAIVLPSEDIVRAAPDDDGARLDLCPDDVIREIHALSSQPAEIDPAYPFLLISRRIKRVMNTAYHEFDSVKKKYSTAPLAMHPDDIAAAGLISGQMAVIRSAAGTATGLVEPDATLRAGVVSMPMGWGDARPDALNSSLTSRLVSLDENLEPFNFMPRFSGIPVAVSSHVMDLAHIS